MRVTYDRTTDVMRVIFSDARIEESNEERPGLVVDYDVAGTMVGLEVLDALKSSYDVEADTLYINLKQPSHATDSALTDDDIIVRYEGEEIVGLTILRASTR
jgi:uncharacterized protein YuzE